MTRKEKALLRDVIRAVIQQHKHAWWELKGQIFDGGYQSYYPMQGEFDFLASRAVERLSAETKAALVLEWRSTHKRADYTDDQILAKYPYLIVAEIVERARIAAYRTVNW